MCSYEDTLLDETLKSEEDLGITKEELESIIYVISELEEKNQDKEKQKGTTDD
jgi:hypothetical protein